MPDPSIDSGQRCYVCGHPVLEGQKAEIRDFTASGLEGEFVPVDEHPVHANPADHLPTLHPLLAEDLSKENVKLTVQHWRERERERAAKLVETYIQWTTAAQALREDDGERFLRFRTELAQRIREGE